jgi:hypothetical protein
MTMDAVFKITASVAGQNSVKELAKNINEASTNGDKLKRSLISGGTALKAFAGSAAVLGLGAFVKKSIDLADSMNDISQRTGVAVETLAKYKVAAEMGGSTIEQFAGGINKLNQSIIAAQESTSKQAGAFTALGISIKDASGELKPTEQLIGEIADKFAQSEDDASKAAVATALFGKSGADLIPVLNQGREGLEKFGLAIDSEVASRADEFNDQMTILGTSLQNVGLYMANELLPGLTSIAEGFNENRVVIDSVVVVVKTLQSAFVGLQLGANVVINAIGTEFAKLAVRAEYLGNVMRGIGSFDLDAIKGASKTLDISIQTIEQGAKDNAAADISRAQNSLDKIWNGSSAAASAQPKITPSRGRLKPSLGYNPGDIGDAAGKAKAATDSTKEFIRTQREALETLRQEADFIGKTTVEVDLLKDARKFDTDVAEKAKDLSGKAKDAFMAETEAIKSQRQELIKNNYEKSRTFAAGAKSAFAQVAEDAMNSAKQTKDVITKAFDGMTDSLTEFAMTGKLNFKDFANSIIKDLIRIALQQSIVGPLAGALGGAFGGGAGGGLFSAVKNIFFHANGGIMTGSGPLPLRTYATGGIASSPQLAMFGEGSMPEAYVPLPDGRSIPVALKNGGGTNVSVVVNMNGADQTTGSNKQGADIGKLIASVVKSTLLNEKRPGGLLAT